MKPATLAYPAIVDEVALDRHAVVEASAGTGKTYALAHLVADLVLRRGVPLGEIVVVTFTEKATAELTARIRGILSEAVAKTTHDPGAAWTLDAEVRGRAGAALTALDTAPIETIHAFARRVLVEEAFLAGRPFDEALADGRRLFRDAFNETVRSLAPGSEGSKRLAAALAKQSLDRLEDIAWAASRVVVAADVPDGWADVAPHLPDAVAASTAPSPWDLVRASLTRTSSAQRDDVRRAGLASAVTHVLEAMKAKKGKKATFPKPERLLAKLVLQAAPVAQVDVAVPALVADLLPRVRETLARTKAATRTLDFDDLLALAEAAVVGPHAAAIGARLRERYRHAFIDEFQDTDDRQWTLFRTLFTGAPGRRLVVIGDPKQAIYAFRGADVHTYLAARATLLAEGATRHDLAVSYRASPRLMEAVNRLLRDDADPAVLEGLVRYVPEAQSAGRSKDAKVARRPVRPIVVFRAETRLAAAEGRLAVLTAIGRELTEVIAKGQLTGSTGEPVRLGEVMVLTYTGADAARAAAHLEELSIPTALVRPDDLWRSREAVEVRAVVAAAAEPDDVGAVRRALATSLFAVRLADLGAFDPDGAPHPYLSTLRRLSRLARAGAWADFARVLLEDSRVSVREALAGSGSRRSSLLGAVLDTLVREAQARSMSPREVVDLLVQLENGRAAVTEAKEPDRALGGRDAVRILTVHKSKGLEAEVVFLYGRGSSKTGEVLPVHVGHRRTLGWNDDPIAAAKHREERSEERGRLAYVALTRARTRLYLHLVPSTGGEVLYTPIEAALLRAHRDDDGTIDWRIIAAPRPGSRPVEQRTLSLGTPWPESPPFEPPPPPRHGPRLTSYSTLAGELARDGAARLDPRADLGFASRRVDPRGVPGGLATGRALHELFERLPLAPVVTLDEAAYLARPEVDALVAEVAFRHALAPEVAAALARMAWSVLRAPPCPGFPPLASCIVARELSITLPGKPTEGDGLFAREAFLRSVLDAVVRHEGRYVVVDYKSDLLPSYDLATATKHVEHYALQARLYRLALERSLAAMGHATTAPVDVAFLLARAAPDDEGRVVLAARHAAPFEEGGLA